jgi:cell division protein FtsW (lipid II flippase)
VSYGNSALLSSVAMLGIIWRIVYERDESYACG